MLVDTVVPEMLLPKLKLPQSQLAISTVGHKTEGIMLNCNTDLHIVRSRGRYSRWSGYITVASSTDE